MRRRKSCYYISPPRDRKGEPTKRTALLVLAAALSSALAYRASTQFGISPVKRPNIANIFHPVVGQGAAYDTSDKDGKKATWKCISWTRRWSAPNKPTGWKLAIAQTPAATAFPPRATVNLAYGKMLVTPADFKFHKMIFVLPGQTSRWKWK